MRTTELDDAMALSLSTPPSVPAYLDSSMAAPVPEPMPESMPDYPRSDIPVAPVLSSASFGAESGKHIPSILDAAEARYVTSGRVAIAMALQQMGIGPGDSVLVPTYHCASMIEPVIWAGAKPVYYKIRPDTSVDLDDIAAKMEPNTKLILATNYFGFPQPLAKIRAFCDANNLFFLEDCAHCFFGEHEGKPVGSYGDYAIASSMKFFPVYDGGFLVSSRHSLAGVNPESAGRGFEAKVAFNTLEHAFEFKRLPLVKALLALPMALKDVVWRKLKQRDPAGTQSIAPGSSDGGFNFDPAWIGKRASIFSRFVMKMTSRSRIVALRQKHYARLHRELGSLPGCRPLFGALAEHGAPWVFPLYVSNPGPVFDALKREGVPIVRFAQYLLPGVDARICPVSAELSEHVLQFPVHQELRESELDWIIARVKHALATDHAKAS